GFLFAPRAAAAASRAGLAAGAGIRRVLQARARGCAEPRAGAREAAADRRRRLGRGLRLRGDLSAALSGRVGLRHGRGTPRSLQIFLARWSFISLWRGT